MSGCIFCNSSSRLLISNLCGHRVCSFCLTRNSFREAKVTSFEKEIKIRKTLKKIFNKREQDFDTLEDYYKYEEWVEDIIYNIVHDVDKAKNEALVQDYKTKNQAFIIMRNEELESEAAAVKRQQKEEDVQRKAKEKRDLLQEIEEEKERRRERERVLTKVQKGELAAKDLEKNLEHNLKRRKRKKEEDDLNRAQVEEEEEEEEKPKEFIPVKKTQTALPKPIGMSKFEAERPEDQKVIQSHAGMLQDSEIEELLRKFECCGYSRDVLRKRAKLEAYNKF